MPTLPSFDYAVVRIVPRVEREEFLNVGVIVFCADHAFLKAVIELDEARLRALSPTVDLETVRDHLQAFIRTSAGGVGSGPIGELPLRERWSWLVAPRSTILQTSAPHVGLCQTPLSALDRLLDHYVRPSST